MAAGTNKERGLDEFFKGDRTTSAAWIGRQQRRVSVRRAWCCDEGGVVERRKELCRRIDHC